MTNQLETASAVKQFNPMLQLVVKQGPNLLKRKSLLNLAARKGKKFLIRNGEERRRNDPSLAPGIIDDQVSLGIAMIESIKRILTDHILSDATYEKAGNILGRDLLIEKKRLQSKSDAFEKEFGAKQPSFILVSPTKACNLHCTGCYADSDEKVQSLDWDIVDRLISEAYDLWGIQFIVVSGGEPMVYRSQGKGLLDLAEKHQDCYFMFYTNGTLITDQLAQRMAELGNIVPMVSLEGWKEQTDARRGKGVFDKVSETMDRLYHAGVLYGASITPTRQNAEIVTSEEFIDYLFFEKHVAVAWMFQYMPIGRSYTLDLMPSPQQRLEMWQRCWQYVREKQVFIADFWNSGTAVDGCLSAGGHGNGGYFYIDWNGNVNPCVFVPYSPVNIKDVYARGETLNDVFNAPFFQDIRKFQKESNLMTHGKNVINPCPIRDHNAAFRQLVRKHEPDPSDSNAAAAMVDPEYAQGMDAYDEHYQAIVDVMWDKIYTQDSRPSEEEIRTIIAGLDNQEEQNLHIPVFQEKIKKPSKV